MANIKDNARSIYDVLQQGSLFVSCNIDNAEDPLIDAFKYHLNDSVNYSDIVYVDSTNTPYEVKESGQVISCNSEGAAIDIILPDIMESGFICSIVHYEGDQVVNVTTKSGTNPIGESLMQTIRNVSRGISVISQVDSGSPEYLIIQDSRGKLNNRIRVTKPSDFDNPIDSGKVYFIDGVVDMSNFPIQPPIGGLTIDGFGFGVSKLISSEDNYTMFNGSNNGDVFISNCEIEVTGNNSRVFDVDNSSSGLEAIEFNTVNFNNCTSIGIITGYRQSLIRNSGFFNCQDGVTFDGTWLGGVRIETFIVRGFGSSGTMFKKGPSLQFQNRFVSDANIDVPSGSIGYDFEESNFLNDELFQLQNGNFTGSGTYINGISESSTKSRFRNNAGILDTYVGGAWSISASAPTTISGTGEANAAKMAGTTLPTNLNWFSHNDNNSLRLDSQNPIVVEVKSTLSLISGNNNQIGVSLRRWDDSESSYVILSDISITTSGSGRAENVVLLAITSMAQNDRIEVWVRNDSAAQDITASVGGQLIVSERKS